MSSDGIQAAGGDRTWRRLLAFLLLILAVLAWVVVASLRNLNRSIAASDWVNHTHAVVTEAEGIESSMEAAEAALRTFLLTGDPRDHETCREAYSDLSGHVEVAKALTKEEPASNRQVLQIEALLAQRAELARQLLQARAGGTSGDVARLLATDAGGAMVHDITQRIRSLKDDENRLLAAQDRTSFLQAETTRWTVLTGTALDLLLLLGVAWLIRDDLAARRRAAIALQEANVQLETRVQERTADLTATNERLVIRSLEDRWGHQALEHQLRYSQLIINSIADLVLVVTKSLNISRLNTAVTRATGWTATDLVDQPLSRIVRPAGAEPALFDPVAQALAAGGDLRSLPVLMSDRQGRATPARLDVFPLRDRDKVVGGVIILHPTAAPPAA